VPSGNRRTKRDRDQETHLGCPVESDCARIEKLLEALRPAAPACVRLLACAAGACAELRTVCRSAPEGDEAG
jgi:hypothetical protein